MDLPALQTKALMVLTPFLALLLLLVEGAVDQTQTPQPERALMAVLVVAELAIRHLLVVLVALGILHRLVRRKATTAVMDTTTARRSV
jgi:hypothetical protein